MAKKDVYTVYELIEVAYEIHYGVAYDKDPAPESKKSDKWNELVSLGDGFDMCNYEYSTSEYSKYDLEEIYGEDQTNIVRLAIEKLLGNKKGILIVRD